MMIIAVETSRSRTGRDSVSRDTNHDSANLRTASLGQFAFVSRSLLFGCSGFGSPSVRSTSTWRCIKSGSVEQTASDWQRRERETNRIHGIFIHSFNSIHFELNGSAEVQCKVGAKKPFTILCILIGRSVNWVYSKCYANDSLFNVNSYTAYMYILC